MKSLPINIEKIILKLTDENGIADLLNSSTIYLVGGFIRDSFLGKKPKDVDIIVKGLSVNEIKNILTPHGRVDIVGESFSVVKYKPAGWKDDIDVALPRIDKKTGEGHKGFEVISNKNISIEEDLKRRDLTINSFCVNIETKDIIDPFNGLKDLQNKILRATDKSAYIEDPLRIMRTIGFASRFDFNIEKSTLKLMKDNAHLVKEISGERILEEFEKVITKGNTQVALQLLHKTGVDIALFDKEMLHYDEGFDYLDTVSFYYMLGLIGDVDPYNFYMKRLRGKSEIGKAIKVLDNLITKWSQLKEDEDKKYLVFNSIKIAPEIINSTLNPPGVDNIILEMRLNKIPMAKGDVQANGEDIMALFGITKGEKVGKILERMYRDALMNRFNWRDRQTTLEYISNLKM